MQFPPPADCGSSRSPLGILKMFQNIEPKIFDDPEVPNDPNDIPPNVFKLRDAFVLETGDEGA